MLPLEDSRLLKPAKNSVAAPSPLQTKPPSSSRVHSSSPPPKPLVTKEDDARETRRFQNQVSATPKPLPPSRVASPNFTGPIAPGVTRQSSPPKPAIGPAGKFPAATRARTSTPLVTRQDDARETRRFQNQVSAGRIASKPTAHGTYGSANAAERHDPNFNVVSGVTKGIIFGTRKPSPLNSSVSHHPPAPHQPYGYDEMRVKSDPTKRTNSNQRTKIWNSMADDPKAPLTEVQREQIRATGRTKPWHNPITGKLESMELSHEPTPHKSGGTTVTPRWPEDHAARDPHRHLSQPVRAAYQNHGDAIRDSFAKEVVHKEWGYTIHPKEVKIKPPELGTSRVVRALENTHLQGVVRGASKALVPVAIGLDVVNLTHAYQKDGFGKEFRKTAGEVAGGWGGAAAGAAAGAALGSVVPGVGTVAGGIIGGIAGGITGSEFGDDIEQGAEELGKGAVEGAKNLWHGVFG